MTPSPRLALFARYPTPGAAKTRLIPALGPAGAADVHRKLTERTVATLSGQGCAVEVHITGAEPQRFVEWLGSQAPPLEGRGWGGACPPETSRAQIASPDRPTPSPSPSPKGEGLLLRFIPQAEGDLTARLTAALNPAPVMFFGADTPDLSREIVAEAVAALSTHDVVIGPAEDGGYYLLGMAHGYPDLLTGIDWSTERVFAQTMAKAKAVGLSVKVLQTLSDCDRPEDLSRWPWLTA